MRRTDLKKEFFAGRVGAVDEIVNGPFAYNWGQLTREIRIKRLNMKTIERAAGAQIDSIVRNLDLEKLKACTTATGIAIAPSLADAAINGMWFFLGVQVDTVGLKPQPVRLLEVASDDAPIYVLLADQVGRVIITSTNGREEVLDGLDRLQIVVEWNTEVGHAC